MAIPYVTGPVHVYVSFGAGSAFSAPGSPLYLGTCERTPELDLYPEYEPTMNTVSGTKIPHDKTYQGVWAICVTNITRWNEPVYARLALYVSTISGAGQVPGRTTGSLGTGQSAVPDMGALVNTQARAMMLWLKFSYADVEPFKSGGMPPGYRLRCCNLAAPTKLSPLGTEASKRYLVWHAMQYYIPATGDNVVFDYAMDGLPLPD